MIVQVKSHLEVISQFAELILQNRIESQWKLMNKPNLLNFIFKKPSHQIHEQLLVASKKIGNLSTIGVELCFFLKNIETSSSQLVETWSINFQIPHQVNKPVLVDPKKCYKQILIQSRALTSILTQTPLFQKFISIKSEKTKNQSPQSNTIVYTVRFISEQTQKTKQKSFNCFEVLKQSRSLPLIPLCHTAGQHGQLKIKVKYINLDWISEECSLQQRLMSDEILQYAPTQAGSNFTQNSNEFSEPKTSLRKGSNDSCTRHARTQSFSTTQMLVYSKKDDFDMLMLAEHAIVYICSIRKTNFPCSADYHYDVATSQQWNRKSNCTVVKKLTRIQYKNTNFWRMIELSKTKFKKNLSQNNPNQLVKTFMFIMNGN